MTFKTKTTQNHKLHTWFSETFEPCYFAQFAFPISNAIVLEAKIDVDDDCDDYDEYKWSDDATGGPRFVNHW